MAFDNMSKKSIAINSIYNMVYKGFSVLFPVITMGYTARILLAEGVGKVDYARTVATYFTTIAALGIPNYGIKVIAGSGNDKHNRSKAFWEMFYINALSTIICSIAYYAFVINSDHFAGRRPLFFVMGSTIILNVISIDWYYQGIEDYKYITVRSLFTKVISLVLIFVLIQDLDDYIYYAMITALALAGNNFFNIFHLRGQISFVRAKDCHFKKHLKAIFMLLGVTLATEVYTMLDTVLLEYIKNEEYVGYYQNCVKIIRLIYTLTIAMVATTYPRISYYTEIGMKEETNRLLSKALKIVMIFAAPAAVGAFFTSESIVGVFLGDSFGPSVNCLKILSVLIVVFSLAYLLGHIVLMASGNEKRILLATICGAATNAILNLLLIPSFGHYGAALASVAAEILVTTILIYFAKQYYTLDVKKGYIMSLIISLAAMMLSLVLIKLLALPTLIDLIISVIVGAGVYFITLTVCKNEAIINIIDLVKTKFLHRS